MFSFHVSGLCVWMLYVFVSCVDFVCWFHALGLYVWILYVFVSCFGFVCWFRVLVP